MARRVNTKRKLVFGVGINDADYQQSTSEVTTFNPDGTPARRITWVCPFYKRWVMMLERSYGKKVDRSKAPTVCDAWLTFSNFKRWMEQQDWVNKYLDYKFFDPENTVYSPEGCCFLSQAVVRFFSEGMIGNDALPVGVYWSESGKIFKASIAAPGKPEYLGSYTSPEEAFYRWLERKRELALTVADNEADPRIKPVILERAKNYPIPDFSEYPTLEEQMAKGDSSGKRRAPPKKRASKPAQALLASSLAAKALNEALSRRRS